MTSMARTAPLKVFGRIAVAFAAFALVGAAFSSDASAAARFADGAYVRSVLACKSSSPSLLQSATYANQSGIWGRIRIYTFYAQGRNVNAWGNWSAFLPIAAGYDYSPDTINALPDGKYTFQIQYARKVNGAWAYVSEYIPVFQISDGWAAMSVLINSATLPQNTSCVLGGSQIVVSYG